ncbi:hypothetical protein [Halobacillus sp. Marseille-Q1614]|uniref:SunI/YnzG family protein n=1 Tax=Halobacillus sp. Marseille-Q1614 TaxID=2709134 RepID=UPI00156E5BE3|nr:hypothetical protein [Halobacillus sp. Marseille-Q1614]
MLHITVTDNNENVILKWQFSKIKIPKNDVMEVVSDDTYAGEDKKAVRIGYPSGSTDRVVIRTKKDNYILFTSQISIKEKIESMIKHK